MHVLVERQTVGAAAAGARSSVTTDRLACESMQKPVGHDAGSAASRETLVTVAGALAKIGGVATAVLYGVGWAILTIFYGHFGLEATASGYDFDAIATRAVGGAVLVVLAAGFIMTVPLLRGGSIQQSGLLVFFAVTALIVGTDLTLCVSHGASLLMIAIVGAIAVGFVVLAGRTVLGITTARSLTFVLVFSVLLLPWATAGALADRVRHGGAARIDFGLGLPLLDFPRATVASVGFRPLPLVHGHCVYVLGRSEGVTYVFDWREQKTTTLPSRLLATSPDPEC